MDLRLYMMLWLDTRTHSPVKIRSGLKRKLPTESKEVSSTTTILFLHHIILWRTPAPDPWFLDIWAKYRFAAQRLFVPVEHLLRLEHCAMSILRTLVH